MHHLCARFYCIYWYISLIFFLWPWRDGPLVALSHVLFYLRWISFLGLNTFACIDCNTCCTFVYILLLSSSPLKNKRWELPKGMCFENIPELPRVFFIQVFMAFWLRWISYNIFMGYIFTIYKYFFIQSLWSIFIVIMLVKRFTIKWLMFFHHKHWIPGC